MLARFKKMHTIKSVLSVAVKNPSSLLLHSALPLLPQAEEAQTKLAAEFTFGTASFELLNCPLC